MFGKQVENYPDYCIRGLSEPGMVVNEIVTGAAYDFQLNKDRTDGYLELSVNWKDEETVIDFTLQQKKNNGNRKFKHGVAILPRNKINIGKVNSKFIDKVSYERKPLKGNKYHGNLLLKKEMGQKNLKRIVASTLALHSNYISPDRDKIGK